MSGSIDSISSRDVDPYLDALAGELYSMREIADIVGRTLRHNKEAQQVAETTSFEQNFQLVNILL